MVWDFIKMLSNLAWRPSRPRRGKALGVKAKARAKATRKFNDADKPLEAAKGKVKGKKAGL